MNSEASELGRVAASLVLILCIALGVHYLAPPGEDLGETNALRAALSVGLLMLGAWLSGRLFERINMPGITGYLLFGMLAGPSLLGLIPGPQIQSVSHHHPAPLHFVNNIAIALIALTAGGEIHLSWLRGRGRQVFTVLLVHIAVLMGVIIIVMETGPSWIPFMDGQDATTALVIAVLCAVVMVAKSPAVTIAMISDYRASGPLSQMTLVITVFKDLILIVMFATVMAICEGVMKDREAISTGFVLAVAVQLIGSLGVGAVIGFAMAWYVEKVRAHMLLFVIGCCLLTALLGDQQFVIGGQETHLEPLLMALAAGMLMENVWPQSSRPLFVTIETLSLPIYCLFFAIAGARIDLHTFASLWHVSVALVAVRLGATWLSIWAGLWCAGMREPWTRWLWLGMVSQAGVSLVIVTLIAEGFKQSAWAAPLKEVMIGAIIINQLIGPIGFRHALMTSGEANRGARAAPPREQTLTPQPA